MLANNIDINDIDVNNGYTSNVYTSHDNFMLSSSW